MGFVCRGLLSCLRWCGRRAVWAGRRCCVSAMMCRAGSRLLSSRWPWLCLSLFGVRRCRRPWFRDVPDYSDVYPCDMACDGRRRGAFGIVASGCPAALRERAGGLSCRRRAGVKRPQARSARGRLHKRAPRCQRQPVMHSCRRYRERRRGSLLYRGICRVCGDERTGCAARRRSGAHRHRGWADLVRGSAVGSFGLVSSRGRPAHEGGGRSWRRQLWRPQRRASSWATWRRNATVHGWASTEAS